MKYVEKTTKKNKKQTKFSKNKNQLKKFRLENNKFLRMQSYRKN